MHTPGPWWTDGEAKTMPGREFPYISVYGPLFEIAQVHGNGKGASGLDARLIAAAPDLLEALKLAVEASIQGRDDKSWEDAAIAAIKKAVKGT
jgi:hypothetical protein